MRSHNKVITLLALFAMGVAFLAQTSPLWLKNAQGTPISICSAFGNKTIIIDENGNEIPQFPTKIKNNCVLCLNANANYTVPTSVQASDITPYKDTVKLCWSSENTTPPSTKHGSYHAIRAPPEYS